MVSNTDLGFLALTSGCPQAEKRRWSKEWYKNEKNRFTHEHLVNLLRDSEPEDYRNFLRMDQESFDYLLELVRPDIEKKDTNMREAISASQRLSITLRYLSSGIDLEDLKFTCAIAPQTGVHHNGNLLSNHEGIEGKHSGNYFPSKSIYFNGFHRVTQCLTEIALYDQAPSSTA
ncbi:hypothetical protein NQ318_012722 [Aromia moschata]|uniref:Uncharacterized protein n=1 Tax=Aromia moschata TaxID=1265417 RepID=A0AAV8Y1N8_9CUCU|nr:hypothetical protein NQ318_012722 [Aromia moschata]